MERPTRIEILREMENLNQYEYTLAYEAFEIGEILQGEFGGYCAVFAAGMLYTKRMLKEGIDNK